MLARTSTLGALRSRSVTPATVLMTLAVSAMIGVGAIALTQVDRDSPVSASIGPDESGSIVDLDVGGELTIALQANPSTGYGWTVTSIDPAVVTQTGEPELSAESNLIGAGATVTFRFTAAGAGVSELRLDYQRPWEGVEPLGTYFVTINVR